MQGTRSTLAIIRSSTVRKQRTPYFVSTVLVRTYGSTGYCTPKTGPVISARPLGQLLACSVIGQESILEAPCPSSLVAPYSVHRPPFIACLHDSISLQQPITITITITIPDPLIP